MNIVSYEGLAGSIGRWVRRGLLSHFPNANKQELVWTDTGAYYPWSEIIVIGHSFGARSAIETAEKSGNVKLLLLLDPRMPPLGTGGFIAPKGVRTVNFYQKGFMRGHLVDGAENHLVRSSHTGVPALKEVRELLKEYLK